MAELHPACAPIAFLLGIWTGEGTGGYPTIEPFAYRERLRFWHSGRPSLHYEQTTSSIDDGAPMHAEMGYWRPTTDGRVEVVIAQALGLAEVSEGRVDGTRIEVVSRRLSPTSSAKEVTHIARVFEVVGDVMRYEVSIAAVGVPTSPHLRAELTRA